LKAGRSFIPLLTLFSFFSVCPGFYFREHYFVTLLPAISLLVGIFTDFLRSKLSGFVRPPLSMLFGSAVFISAVTAGLVSQRGYLFQDDPVRISRKLHGVSPFPASIPVAEFIASASDASEKIAVLGSEPQIYFYSRRASATGYLYMYSLMENHPYAIAMQMEMIREIESSQPKFMVLVTTYSSWLQHPNSETHILGWLRSYLKDHYSPVGIADIISADSTEYVWNAGAADYKPRGLSSLRVYERR